MMDAQGIIICRPDVGIKSMEGKLRDRSGSTAPADRFLPQPRKVSHVALVGGATHMPSVQAFISRLTGVPVQVHISQNLHFNNAYLASA